MWWESGRKVKGGRGGVEAQVVWVWGMGGCTGGWE